MNNLSGCSFNCEDHFPIHIFIRSSKYESFLIFPEVTIYMVDHNLVSSLCYMPRHLVSYYLSLWNSNAVVPYICCDTV